MFPVNVLPMFPVHTTSGGEEGTINNFGSSDSAGMTFEAGFEPDYALRVFGDGSGNAYTNWYDFAARSRIYAGEAGNAGPITAGPISEMLVFWSDIPADGTDFGTVYPAHADGIEVKLNLSAMGVPAGMQTVKVMAMLVNGGSDYGSNQVLGGRTGVPTDMGNQAAMSALDWGTEPGTQTITINVNNNDNDGDGDPDATDPDDDNDNLDDVVETGTGIYVDANDTGTNQFIADTDEDGFLDGEEVDTSALGYLSDPNCPNYTDMAAPGSFNGFTAADGGVEMTQGSTASLTEQYQWSLDYLFDSGDLGNITFKFTSGDSYAINWGAAGGGSVARNGADINATIDATGAHRFFFDQKNLTYTFERLTFNTLGEYLAAYGVASGGNDDGDDLTNDEEFALNTDPTNADTDGDGLDDDLEGPAGTNALNPDSDGDGLLDGVESNSGTFVDENDTGTNPDLADTDGDGENDGVEVSEGTDPTERFSSSAAFGNAIVDGTLDGTYGGPIAVQTIETGFGDNGSEWNAAYATVANGRLYLMFTGNLEANFNKLNIFIDSVAGGSATFTSAGNDGSGAMNTMGFDASFAPDYHLIARRGESKFDLDFALLDGVPDPSKFTFHTDVFGGTDFGSGATGTGVNLSAVKVGYNGSNTAGIGGSAGNAADPVAAAAVTTGLELCIDLADIGSPAPGSIKVMLLQANNSHGSLSNQTLAGLPVGTGNLGNPTAVDFSALAGDQFFSVSVPENPLMVKQVGYVEADDELKLVVTGLVPGTDYKVTESMTLVPPFSDLSGSTFTAMDPAQLITVPADTALKAANFFQVVELP
jgi:hypothetical protein